MLLLLRTTHKPATDLGFLLHKNPARVHEAEMPFGKAVLFYPEATEVACTAAILLDVDPVGMVRGNNDNARWDQYVNDRPYVASSFLSSAILEFCSTAMGGRSKERPELAASPVQFEVGLPSIRCRGGEPFLRGLFEPLGYAVEATALGLDERFPEWGAGTLHSVTLRSNILLKDLLRHLYVLIPVLDDDKHYWVGKDEVEKLLTKGGDWLPKHPLKEEIAKRYLLNQRHLARDALARLSEIDGDPDPDAREAEADEALEQKEKKLSLHDQRLDAVADVIKGLGAQRVLDLGCGEGKLLRRLLKIKEITEVVGMDVALQPLERARRFLRMEQMSDRQLERVKLVHGSLTYRDRALEGYDAAALVEVIEHLDTARLQALERTVFEFAQPRAVIVTTPNREYNDLFEGMVPGALRHPDHRFEWTRVEFRAWADRVADSHGYSVELSPLGGEDPDKGAPSQMAVFRR